MAQESQKPPSWINKVQYETENLKLAVLNDVGPVERVAAISTCFNCSFSFVLSSSRIDSWHPQREPKAVWCWTGNRNGDKIQKWANKDRLQKAVRTGRLVTGDWWRQVDSPSHHCCIQTPRIPEESLKNPWRIPEESLRDPQDRSYSADKLQWSWSSLEESQRIVKNPAGSRRRSRNDPVHLPKDPDHLPRISENLLARLLLLLSRLLLLFRLRIFSSVADPRG